MNDDLCNLSAVEARDLILDGRISSEALTTACLQKISDTDAALKAWAFIDEDAALYQARTMDAVRKTGRATGILHGVPVGLKDIIDTAGLPTENGSPACAGRQPAADAAIVERLAEAGAVVLGKTKTTEFAFLHPTDTTNPHDPTRTPGGSSSGSAAAVAAGQVPVAIGTQTGGSVIRPASFCGTFGIKPTRGHISRRGVLRTSVSLDTVGTFGRTLADAALLADAIAGYDPADPASMARPRCRLAAGVDEAPPVPPAIAWYEMPHHDRLDADAREGIEAVIAALGGHVERFDVAPTMGDLVATQELIHEFELVQHLSEVIDRHHDLLSETVKPAIARARSITQTRYEDAMAVKASAEAFFAKAFEDFDAILSPSATGEAPGITTGTGDPAFCKVWSLCGLPCVTMPVLVGNNDLPIGVQLVGGVEEDQRLMRTANWMLREISDSLGP